MAAAAISNFENRLPFLRWWTDSHQIQLDSWESAMKRNCHIKSAHLSKLKIATAAISIFRKSVAISFLSDQSSLNLMGMLRIWHRTQLLYKKCTSTKIPGGGRHHLEFRKSVAISLLMNQSTPKLMRMLRICHRTHLSYQKCSITKIEMAAAAILNFESLLPFLCSWTNIHQIWWECWELDRKRKCLSKIA